jgi:hypothetical protein
VACCERFAVPCFVPCASAGAARTSGTISKGRSDNMEASICPNLGGQKTNSYFSLKFPVPAGRRSRLLAIGIKGAARSDDPLDALLGIDGLPSTVKHRLGFSGQVRNVSASAPARGPRCAALTFQDCPAAARFEMGTKRFGSPTCRHRPVSCLTRVAGPATAVEYRSAALKTPRRPEWPFRELCAR